MDNSYDIASNPNSKSSKLNNGERSELTSWRARVSVHAIRKCSIYEDLCRFQYNSTVEGLDPGYLRCEPPGKIVHYCTITSNI